MYKYIYIYLVYICRKALPASRIWVSLFELLRFKLLSRIVAANESCKPWRSPVWQERLLPQPKKGAGEERRQWGTATLTEKSIAFEAQKVDWRGILLVQKLPTCVFGHDFFSVKFSKHPWPEFGWKKKDRIPAKSPESLVGGTWLWLRERIPARFWGPNSLVSAAEMQLIPCEVLALDFCSKFVWLLELSQIPWKIPEMYWKHKHVGFLDLVSEVLHFLPVKMMSNVMCPKLPRKVSFLNELRATGLRASVQSSKSWEAQSCRMT